MHLALLGDSTLDCDSYTDPSPDVAGHLRTLLPEPAQVTLCAVDGATTRTFPPQLERVPPDVTHLVLSLGGNDALQCMPLLNEEVGRAAVAFALLGRRVAEFEQAYRRTVHALLAHGKPLLLCTIYEGDFSPEESLVTRTALAPFNDVIIRVAIEHDLALLDLRAVCSEPADFTLQVEPSAQGARAIAEALAYRLAGVEA